MYLARDIRAVHLEITTKCNASCPMCLRNICGGAVNPQLPLTELKLADIQKIFPAHFIRQLDRMYMCGNYGDPVVAQDTLDVFRYFKECHPHIKLSMFTNGSARPESWWSELAKVTQEVHFAIDGLSDTNHIYRRGTSFDLILKNAQTYIDSGGKAVWDYLVFRHNEHQVEEARSLAEKMKFHKFVAKKTGRFFSNTKSEVKNHQAVLNKEGLLEYYLEMPLNEKYQNTALQKEAQLVEKYGHLEKYLDSAPVACKADAEKSIYVSADGFIFPCCWTGNQLYPWYFEPRQSQVWKLLDGLMDKERSISGLHYPIEQIIEGDFFSKVQKSWDLPSVKQGKLKCCAKTCGKEFDPFKSQFES